MSEFKFSCPNCRQNIQATSEYSGHQVNCPSCQTLLVVPAAPDAPAPAPAAGPRLSVAASTPASHSSASEAAATAASAYTARPVRKKKPKLELIAGIAAGVIALAATIYYWPQLMKMVSHSGKPVDLVEQAATNAAPPPPPELTTEEILQKVADTYKGLTDYAAKGQTTCDLDMSAIPRAPKNLRMTANSSLQLGRTNNYRLEWDQTVGGQPIKGAAWSAGKGNFVAYGPYPPSKVKTRQLALARADESFLLSSSIAELFFSDTNSFADMAKDLTKTNNPALNAYESYVLTGEINHIGVLIWINKNSFMVTQLEGILGTPIDDADLKKIPSAQRAQVAAISKIKGTIIEAYSNIQTNQNLVASAFESPYQTPGNSAIPTGARGKFPGSQAGAQSGPRRRGGPPQ